MSQQANNEGKQPNSNKRRRQQMRLQQQQQGQQMKGIMPQQERSGIQSKPSKKRKQQGQPPRQNALFPNSYASFEEIPENFKTDERDFYLIYFNLLNESWWYYPSFLLENDQRRTLGPSGGIINLEHFPYHESAIYFFLMRDEFFKVEVSLSTDHEIVNIIMGYNAPLEPQPQRSYKLTINKVPEANNSAYEFINNKYLETNNTNIRKLAELLLPFENVRRDQRERQRERQRRERQQRQQRLRLAQQEGRRYRARLAQQRRRLADKTQKDNNPQGGPY